MISNNEGLQLLIISNNKQYRLHGVSNSEQYRLHGVNNTGQYRLHGVSNKKQYSKLSDNCHGYLILSRPGALGQWLATILNLKNRSVSGIKNCYDITHCGEKML